MRSTNIYIFLWRNKKIISTSPLMMMVLCCCFFVVVFFFFFCIPFNFILVISRQWTGHNECMERLCRVKHIQS